MPIYQTAQDGRTGWPFLDPEGAPMVVAEGILLEHRKPPLVLVRRGVALFRAQRRVVRHAQSLGCQAVTPDQAYVAVRGLR